MICLELSCSCKLVLIALDDEDLHYLIETTSCIPAQSADVLNKPSDLVLENGLLGDMFDIQDGRLIRSSIEVLALEKFSKTSIGMSMTITPQSLLTVNRKSSAI
jgi:hypothetical protein